MNRGYTLIWRKLWANPLLCEPGKKFTRLEAWLYLTNVLATGIDKLKMTDFKTEVLFDLVDSLYRQKHGLIVTGNYSMRDLVEHERMHPAIVRRLDDMCRVIEV
jgi:predicted ATPase